MTTNPNNKQTPALTRAQRERLKRKNGIIDAAQKRFFEAGFDDVSMEDIAGDLELSKPALYRYFTNKESLFLAVASRGMDILRGKLAASVANQSTGFGKVSAYLNALCFGFAREDSDYHKILLAIREQRFTELFKKDGVNGGGEFEAKSLEALNLLVDAVQLGGDDGTVKPDLPPLQTAIFLASAAEAAINMTPEYQKLLENTGLTKDEYLSHSIDLMLTEIAEKTA
jgi:TetR/AcrR family transcriptional regulator